MLLANESVLKNVHFSGQKFKCGADKLYYTENEMKVRGYYGKQGKKFKYNKLLSK